MTCKYCGKRSYNEYCFQHKPHKRLKPEADKTQEKRTDTKWRWIEANPPDDNGNWRCYLRISKDCPGWLTLETLVLEHVKPKAGYPELRYDLSNLRPACIFCNETKKGLSLERLAIVFPHLGVYLTEQQP